MPNVARLDDEDLSMIFNVARIHVERRLTRAPVTMLLQERSVSMLSCESHVD
jgi:hypothetical protein